MTETTANAPPLVAEKPRQHGRLFVKIMLPVLIIALASAGFVILQKTKKQPPPKVIEERTWVVKTIKVALHEHTPILKLYGQTEAPRRSQLSAAVTADVISVHVAEGQAVAAQEVLLQLDAREAELLLAQRRAEVAEIDALISAEKHKHANDLTALPREQNLLEYAQKAVTRAKKLESQQVASQATLDEASQTVERQKLVVDTRRLAISNHPAQLAQLNARRERAQALLALARLDVERCIIRAPFAGIISAVNIAPGERARVGNILINVYAQNELEIRTQIPQRHYALIEALTAQKQSLNARSDDGVLLELARLSGSINPQSGGIDALLNIHQGGEHLRLGQFLNLRLFLPPQNNLMALPYEAVYGGSYVYTLEDSDNGHRMRRIRIEHVGESETADGIPVLLARSDAWKNGDTLVASQLPNAIDGLKVTAELN
jgi:HlyD family secretion protein